ncbi:2-oxoacid:ferredoxin oxidoreductase subunit beta [Candidatus Pacearchaeota archaeon]|nr:2-oxoacid:ferredoxin oxidoreductase subunit beta [Candidatus Pacearchaeota archaeon]
MSLFSKKLDTDYEMTWCPGCPNHMILAGVKQAIKSLKKQKYKHESFALTTDVGCSSKIFDYININGLYGLHGRAIPAALGLTLGNPNLNVMAFMGDGGAYSEGISHFIHAARFNSNMTIIVHDNQSFSLTTGQCTPTSQIGFKSKAEPMGEVNQPLNPVKMAIASGMTFIARTNAKDIAHTAEVIEKAIKHPGCSFVEIIQDCLIFNKEINNKDKLMYKIKDNKNKAKAELLANQWDYNGKNGKIPIGVIYQEILPTLQDKWPRLKELKDKKIGWAQK